MNVHGERLRIVDTEFVPINHFRQIAVQQYEFIVNKVNIHQQNVMRNSGEHSKHAGPHQPMDAVSDLIQSCSKSQINS